MPFSIRRLTKTQLLACSLLVALAVLSFALNRRSQTAQANPVAVAAAVRTPTGYVSRGRLQPLLRDALEVWGDRLEQPGKERVTLVSTLSRKKDEKLTARLILEYPDKLRLEEPDGVTVYDGKQIKSTKKNRSMKDDDEIESLLSDSAEHFFTSLANGAATRFLGQRFRMDDGTTKNYTGLFCDPYLVQDPTTSKKATGQQAKIYYLNSDTLLLERVRFEDKNGKTKIEVQFSDWQKVNGQFIPGKISRWEDGALVTSLTISQATVGPKAQDGIFVLP